MKKTIIAAAAAFLLAAPAMAGDISCSRVPQLRQKATLSLVSAVSITEGGAHDVIRKDSN